jgi:hypothetical protein
LAPQIAHLAELLVGPGEALLRLCKLPARPLDQSQIVQRVSKTTRIAEGNQRVHVALEVLHGLLILAAAGAQARHPL